MAGAAVKIVVAEDDRTTRVLLTRALERWGYEVTGVEDGEAAWEVLQAEGTRMLVTDWEMPRLDGPALCERIRETLDGRYVYVLLLTSHKEPVHIVQGLDAGADDFVSKPFNPAELRARLGVGRRILALQDQLAAMNRELELTNAELARIAATDALLQIGNRRSFEDAITRIHAFARRGTRCYGLLMVDVDHFKQFNDRHGHAFGDRVLAEVANSLRVALAGQGEIFRYGGEEIVIVVPEQTANGVRAIAEHLRAAVAAARVDQVDGGVASVTASIGAAYFNGHEAVTCQVIVDRADTALYQAKRDGRNRVLLWSPGTDTPVPHHPP